ncbi:helix-turn-helix domain-containing protein [Chloroflexota bacterium]
MPVIKDYLNAAEAAEILGIHPGTVKRLCREQKLVAQKVHNGWLVHKDEVESFAQKYNGHRGRPANRLIKNIKE